MSGRTYKAIFCMCAKNNAYKRGSFYNHAVWHDTGREFYYSDNFFDDMKSRFATEDDVEKLRQTKALTVTDDGGTDGGAAFGGNALKNLLHALYTVSDKKIAVTLDAGGDFDYNARLLMKNVFTYLNINLRISTSYVVSTDLDAFKGTDFKLCVIPASVLGGGNDRSLNIIRYNEPDFIKTDSWAEFVNWLADKDEAERDKFFRDYEEEIGKTELSVGNKLLKYRQEWVKPKPSAVKKTEPSPEPAAEPKPEPKAAKKTAAAEQKIKTEPKRGLEEIKEINESWYVGQCLNGKKDGWGAVFLSKGFWRTGEWKDGEWVRGLQKQPDGKVKKDGLTAYGNDMYTGDNKKGTPNGCGTLLREDGTWYTGEFKDGLRHGWGMELQRDGNLLYGKWDSDVFDANGWKGYPYNNIYEN
jgi:hypothetical protein